MEEIKCREYFPPLQEKLSLKQYPFQVFIELTHRCNFNCVHCYLGEELHSAQENKELSSNQWKNIIDQLCKIGTFEIVFTGGEIFLRKDTLDILIYAREKGFWVSVLTNGSLITEEILDKLVEYNIISVEVSFNGASKDTFEKITRAEGSYEKVLSNLKMIREKGIAPTLKPCILKFNLQEIPQIMDLAKRYGFSFSYWDNIMPCLNGDRSTLALRISPKERLEIEARLSKYVSQSSHAHRRESCKRGAREQILNQIPGKDTKGSAHNSLFNCMAGQSMFCINPYGKAKACVLLPFPGYDLLKKGAEDCWEAVKSFVDSSLKPKDYRCDACALSNICAPCPAIRYLETGDMAGCVEYYRDAANLIRKKRL